MFLSLLILGTLLIVGSAIARGPREAVVAAIAAVLVAPMWLVQEVGAVLLTLRVCYALLGIACVVLHPQTNLRLSLIATDFLVVALAISQFASELATTNTTMTVGVEIALQWLTPYVLGRLAWRSADDGRRLAASLARVGAVLAVWSIVESVTRVNWINSALGFAGSLQSQHDLRWGLRRAEGPLTHPIFFGVQLVLLAPFALEAARQAAALGRPAWKHPLVWLAAAGTLCTMSRGPQLALIAVFIAAAAYAVSRWRTVIVVPSGLAVVAMLAAPGAMIDLLHHWSGETSHMSIDIRGEYVPYTGTTHRLLQVRVYEETLAHAGWLGYGSVGLRAGAMTLPYVEDHLRKMFSSIDNHYLQFTLQCGYLGLGLFLALVLTGIGYAVAAARRDDCPTPWLAAGTAASLAAVTVMLSTVWLAGDIRFALMLAIGTAGGMCASRSATIAVKKEAAREPASLPTLRLMPGHAT